MPRMGTALELEAERAQEFQDGPAIRPQRRLVLAPGLGVGQRLVDAAPSASRPFDDAPIDQEQEDRGPLMQGRPGPELRAGQVVLEMEPGITRGLFEQGEAVLVVAMSGVVGQSAGPVACQLIHE